MKNSIIAGVFGVCVGTFIGLYRFELHGALTRKSIEQLQEEIQVLESGDNKLEKFKISKVILSNAIRQAGNSNPELKEFLNKELFTNYIVTKQAKTLEEIENKYKNGRLLRFRRFSPAELLGYKSKLESEYYKKMKEDLETFSKESGKIYVQSSQEILKIIVAEGKAMSSTTEK